MALTPEQLAAVVAKFEEVFGKMNSPEGYHTIANQWNLTDPATAAAAGVGGPIDPLTGLPSGQAADVGIKSLFGGANPMANWGLLPAGYTPSMAERQSVYDQVAATISNPVILHMLQKFTGLAGPVPGTGGAGGVAPPTSSGPPTLPGPPIGGGHPTAETLLSSVSHAPGVQQLGPPGSQYGGGHRILGQSGLPSEDLWTQRRTGFPRGHPLSRLLSNRY
jgi:hypothetical protein